MFTIINQNTEHNNLSAYIFKKITHVSSIGFHDNQVVVLYTNTFDTINTK